MCERLQCRHGCAGELARRTTGAGGVPPAFGDGAALVVADRGRGPAHAGGRRAGRGLDRPRRGRTGRRWPPGGVAVVRGPGHYTVADDPGREPQVVIHPGQVCTTVAGEPLVEAMALGVRTWGNSPTGSTVLLTGTYQHRSELSARLLAGLPVVVVPVRPMRGRARWWRCWPRRSLGTNPGQEAVLDRLLDLLLIAVLRAWFAREGHDAPGLVPGLRRPGGRAGVAPAAQQPGPRLDGGRPGRRGRGVTSCAGPAVPRRWSESLR